MVFKMSRRYFVVLSLLLSACGGGSGGSADSQNDEVIVDQEELALVEVVKVPSQVGNVAEIDYVFNSNQSGSLSIEGKCSVDPIQVVEGNNTIYFKDLATGVYDDCLLTITSTSSDQSTLQISPFSVDNTPPTISLTNSINRYQANIGAVEIDFESDDSGTFQLLGLCDSSGDMTLGSNSVSLVGLAVGDYHNCQLVAQDSYGNQSSALDISPFFVHLTEIPYITYEGQDDSLIQLDLAGITLSTSTDQDCDWDAVETCPSGVSLDVEENVLVVDSNKTLSNDAFYVLDVAGQKSMVANTAETEAYFESLVGHDIVTFKDKLWVFGGSNSSGPNNDIWSSEDGRHWEIEISTAAFSKRTEHEVVEFNGKLWLIGGTYYSTELNDIWSSQNGIDWIEESTNEIFTPRKGHQAFEFNDKLWLVGGYEGGSAYLNDVWSSENGIDWMREVEEAAFSKRSNHKIVLFNEKLWLIGGEISGASSNKNDVWSSQDGITWTEELQAAPFSGRAGHKLISFGNRMWVIGGAQVYSPDAGWSNDVWSSLDGVEWVEEISSTPFPQTRDYGVEVFQSKIWLIGGNSWKPKESYKNDVWSSVNGVVWNRESSEPDLPKISRHQSAVLNDRIYVTQDDYVWSSSDGASWKLETDDSGFGSRNQPSQMVSFAGKLWLYGGTDDPFSLNAFWSSEDGNTWTKINDSQSLFNRAGHQMIVQDDKLWLFGGATSDRENDVWFSSDGINWQEVNYVSKFALRNNHQAAFFNEKFWMIEGDQSASSSEIWSSIDGADWTLETDSAAFGLRLDHQVVVFKDKLWLIAGTPNFGPDSIKNDIWSSIDGINWVLEKASAAFSPRFSHQVEVYDEKLWLIGGKDSTFTNLNDVWVSENGTDWRKTTRGKFLFP